MWHLRSAKNSTRTKDPSWMTSETTYDDNFAASIEEAKSLNMVPCYLRRDIKRGREGRISVNALGSVACSWKMWVKPGVSSMGHCGAPPLKQWGVDSLLVLGDGKPVLLCAVVNPGGSGRLGGLDPYWTIFVDLCYFLTLMLFTGLTGSIPKITSVSYTILLFFTSGSYVSRALTYVNSVNSVNSVSLQKLSISWDQVFPQNQFCGSLSCS